MPPLPQRGFDLLLIPTLVLALGLLSLVLTAWMSHINELRLRHSLLVNAIMDLQIRAATFHVAFEEHIEEKLNGLPAVSAAEVWSELDRSLGLSQTIRGGDVPGAPPGIGPPLDPHWRTEAEAIHGRLGQLRDLAATILASLPAEGLHGDLDRRFDGTFREIQRRAYALQRLAEDAKTRNHVHLQRLAAGVLSLWTVIIAFAAIGVYRHQRARLRAEDQLWDAREALERANRELESRVEEKTESLRAANAALTQKVTECSRAQESLLDYQARLRELSSQLTLAEERERRRIATELHDRIGTALAFARMKLLPFLQPPPEGSPAGRRELVECLALIEQAIADARSLSFELSAPALYELGLEAALEWLAERIGREHRLRVEVEYDDCTKDLPEDVRVLIFQAVRELLANVVKHARAANVRIECRQEGADLRIAVLDDGRGFQQDAKGGDQGPDGGFGLFSIRERLGSLGGAVEVESTAEGTRVTLIVPLSGSVLPEASP